MRYNIENDGFCHCVKYRWITCARGVTGIPEKESPSKEFQSTLPVKGVTVKFHKNTAKFCAASSLHSKTEFCTRCP